MKRRWLPWLGRIDRYVLSLFFSSYATAFLLVVGLFLVIDMSQNLDEYVAPMKDATSVSRTLVLRYYVLAIPFVFLQVGPFVTLVAGLFTLGKLVKLNEIVPVLAAGIGARRMMAPLVVAGALIGAGTFGLRELLGAKLADRRDSIRWVLEKKLHEQVFTDLALRDAAGSLLLVGEYRPDPDDGGPPEGRAIEAHVSTATTWTTITAQSMRWDPELSVWRLTGGSKSETGADRRVVPVDVLAGFDFSPELVRTYQRKEQPLDLSFAEVRELSRRDPDDVKYQTLLHYLVTWPLAHVVLLLVGLPLLVRHERGRGALTAAAACLLCVAYFATDFVCRNLGLQGALQPAISAWLPVLVFGSLGIALYDSMRS